MSEYEAAGRQRKFALYDYAHHTKHEDAVNLVGRGLERFDYLVDLEAEEAISAAVKVRGLDRYDDIVDLVAASVIRDGIVDVVLDAETADRIAAIATKTNTHEVLVASRLIDLGANRPADPLGP